MNLNLNIREFEKQQGRFVDEMVVRIMVKLKEAGMEGLEMENTTALIAFSLASALDDTANIEIDGVEVRPYLTFRTSDEEIVHSGENSNTYSYVRGALEKLFNPKPANG